VRRAGWVAVMGVWLVPLWVAQAATQVRPTLQLTIEERYDDDVLLREAGTVGAELMTKLTPRAGLQLTGRTLELSGWYAADLQARHMSGTLRLDHRGHLEANKRLTPRTSVDLDAGVWRVTDPTSLPRMGVSRTFSPVLYGSGRVGLNSRVSRRWSARLQYQLEASQVFDPAYPTPPGASHAPSAEAWYAATRRTSLGVGYRFQYFVFGPQTAQAHTPEALLRHRLDRHTTATLRAGPVGYWEPQGAPGLAPSASLNVYRRLRRVDLGLTLGQDLVGASGFSSAVWAQYGSLHAGWRHRPQLRTYVGASVYRNGRAPGTVDDYLSPSAEGVSFGYGVGAGLEWELNTFMSVQGQLERVVQVGELGPEDLTRNIAAVRLVLRAF
jgi:hypothetical protein